MKHEHIYCEYQVISWQKLCNYEFLVVLRSDITTRIGRAQMTSY